MPFDDEQRYPDIARRSGYPVAAMVAGIIWIVVGGLLVLSGAGCLGIVVIVTPRVGPNADWMSLVAVLVGCLLFGLVFLLAGIQTVRGSAGGILGTGAMSVVGGLVLFAGAVLLVITGLHQRREWLGRIFGAGMIGVAAPVLLMAGILAISGKQYRAWRSINRQRSVEW